MLARGDRVLVAVSGGPDSVALLHLLVGLKEKLGLHLEAAHLQHGIRGSEAAADALLVSGLAERLGIPFHLREIDLPAMKSSKGRGNLEAMGREERYCFFAELANRRRLSAIAVGHTRDDQAETVLMRLIRGSGRRGLAGIPPVRMLASGGSSERLRLIRPLIESSRESILEYLRGRKLRYRVDQSNSDPALLRNWVRLNLLPQLRQRAGAGLDERLASMAEVWRDEERFLDRIAEERLLQILKGERVSRESLLLEEKAIQRKLLRAWLQKVTEKSKEIGLEHVEAALDFIVRGPPQGRQSLPGDRELVREYDSLRLARRERKGVESRRYVYSVPWTGEIVIPEAGLRLRSSTGVPHAVCTASPSGMEALFDRSRLPGTLSVRNFRPGDRFQPLGMRGHKKVKDLFIEKKVPLETRQRLPILVAGEEVLWIPGCARSDLARVTPETGEILQVAVETCADRTPGPPAPDR